MPDEQRYADVLDRCLSLLQAGLSVEQCVAQYPEHAPGLRQQLTTAETAFRAQSLAPRPAALARDQARTRLLTAAAERRERSPLAAAFALLAPVSWIVGSLKQSGHLAHAAPAVAAVALLGGAAIGVSAATGQGPAGSLLGLNNSDATVSLQGSVTSVDCAAGTVAIDGIEVLIDADTELHGGISCDEISVGMLLNVQATDDDGHLIADDIGLKNSGPGSQDDDGDDNQGPGNQDDDGDDNQGPGNQDDDDGDDNQGPGNQDDDGDDNQGPGSQDDHDGDDGEGDTQNSGDQDGHDGGSGDDATGGDGDDGQSQGSDGGGDATDDGADHNGKEHDEPGPSDDDLAAGS